MAARKSASTVVSATPAINTDMMAQFAAFMAAQAPKAAAPKAAAPKAASVDPQALIDSALETAGIKVTRFGTQPAKISKTGKTVGRWVDAKVGGVRFQGNLIIAIK